MSDIVREQGPSRALGGLSSMSAVLSDALNGVGPPLLFAFRLWASVCLALYVAFWLELDNPFWAGTSAAIVCQPQLGASLRKGWFRMIGTLIGATMIVVLTGFFPQDRIAFLGLLALWGALCAFGATVFRNFASYSAALAGYTALIIAAETLGATGGPSSEVFMVAVTRASEICIGIACAGIVLAGTDLGGARHRLASTLADLAAEIAGGFTSMLAKTGSQLQDMQQQRRELVRKVIALEPAVDQAIGESSELRYHLPILDRATNGLLRALDGWRQVATHLSQLPQEIDRNEREHILQAIPSEFRSSQATGSAGRWVANPLTAARACEEAVDRLLALPTDTPILRLVADEAAKVLTGILRALDGLALLVDAPDRPRPASRPLRRSGADWLPALVSAGRAFVAIGMVELFWVVTAWPNGASMMVFVAILVLLLSPKGDLAYGGAIAFTLGTVGSVVCAAIIKFAVLPGLGSFPAFSAALGLVLIPVGFAMASSRRPAALALFSAMGVNFLPLLAPTNQMSYNTVQFYNSALAVFSGCAAAVLSFGLLPPLSPAFRARRLLVLTLRDLRRLASNAFSPSTEEWEGRMYSRLAAFPDSAEPLQRAQLLAALSIGNDILQLRHLPPVISLQPELDAALVALAQGRSNMARIELARLDRRLASQGRAEQAQVLQARARTLSLSETLAQYGSYFDSRVQP